MQNNLKNREWLVYSNGDLSQVASEVIHAIGVVPCFIELQGEMGVGKTTLVHALLLAAEISGKFLGSPTFPILHRYSLKGPVGVAFHLDLYRVSGDEELSDRGIVESVWTERSLLLVEWATNAPRFRSGVIRDLYPGHSYLLSLELAENLSRRITLSALGL